MEFGMFHEFQRLPGASDAHAFADSFAQVDEADAGGEALRHLSAALSVAESFGAWSTANRVREGMVAANLQRGALDEAERELKLTTPGGGDQPGDMSMFDTGAGNDWV